MGDPDGSVGHLYTELSLSPQLLGTLIQQSAELQSVTPSGFPEPGPAMVASQGDAVSFNGLGQGSSKWPYSSPWQTVALFKRPEALTPLVLSRGTNNRSSIDAGSTDPSQPLFAPTSVATSIAEPATTTPDPGAKRKQGLPCRRITLANSVIQSSAMNLAVDGSMDAQDSTSSSASDTESSDTSGVYPDTHTLLALARYYGRSLVDTLTHIRLTAEVRRILILAWLVAGMGVALYIIIMGALSLDSSRSAHLRSKCSYQAQLLADSFVAHVKEVDVYRGLLETFYLSPAGPRMNQSDFSLYSKLTGESRPAVDIVVYAPKVRNDDRAAFERAQGGPILDKTGGVRASASFYAPAVLCNPGVAENLLRRDILEDPTQSGAAVAAMTSGQWALTPPYRLPFFDWVGVGYATPFYSPGFNVEKARVGEREAALVGWLGVSYNFGSIVSGLTASGEFDPSFRVWVLDTTDSSATAVLHCPPDRPCNGSQVDLAQVLTGGRHLAWPLELGDKARRYEMVCEFVGGRGVPWPSLEWAVAVGAMTALLAVMMHGVARRVETVEEDFLQMERLKDEMVEAKTAAESADVAKSQFLATVSHEIRTPMNGVLGMLALLRDTGLSTVQTEYVETARSSGQALVSLINDVLDFSKIDAGRMDLEARPFDIRAEVDTVLGLFVEKVRGKGEAVELAALVQDAVPDVVVGDPTRLRQVLQNLIANSAKFTAAGHILLTIRIAGEKEELKETHCPRPSSSGLPDGFLYVEEGEAGRVKLEEKRRRERKMRLEVDLRLRRKTNGCDLPPFSMLPDKTERPRSASNRPLKSVRFERGRLTGDPKASQRPFSMEDLPPSPPASSSCRTSPNSPMWGVEGEEEKLFPRSSTFPSEILDASRKSVEVCSEGTSPSHSTLSGRQSANSTHTFVSVCKWLKEEQPKLPEKGDPRAMLRLVVCVEDTGCGIPESAQARIFQPFSMVDSSSARAQGGTGIGLSISHKLVTPAHRARGGGWGLGAGAEYGLCGGVQVELQGGSLGFVSRLGVGSTFFFDVSMQLPHPDSHNSRDACELMKLPKATGSRHLSSLNSSDWPPGTDQLAGRQVLLLDNMKLRWQVLASQLKQLGLRVDATHSLDHALLLVQTAQSQARNGVPLGTNASEQEGEREVRSRVSSPPSWSSGWLTPTSTPSPSQGSPSGSFIDHRVCGYEAVVVDSDSSLWAQRGLEVGRALQDLGSLADIPLVLVMRTPDRELEAAARAVGFKGFLLKPVRRALVARGVLDALGLAAPKAAGRAPKAVNPNLISLLKGKKFLVVDDNAVNRCVASRMLKKYGVVSETVDGGRKALERLGANHRIDAVLMDIQMPEMDGYETSCHIRDQEKEANAEEGQEKLRYVPIIAMTADVLQGTKEKCMASGMDGYLTKPIDEDLFYRTCLKFFQPA